MKTCYATRPLRRWRNAGSAILAAVVIAACGGSGGGDFNDRPPSGPVSAPAAPSCSAEKNAEMWASLSCPEGKLCIGEVSGNEIVNISVLTSGRRPDWSPDGTQLVFERPQYPAAGPHGSVHRINADGTDEVKLVDGRDPDWSPDGRKIAFRNHDGIAVMNVDGSDMVALIGHELAGTDISEVRDPAWSPDSQRIVFVSSGWSPTRQLMQLYDMDSRGNDLRLLAGASNDSDIHDPSWSPDGGSIALIRDHELVTVDTTGGDPWVVVADIGPNARRTDWTADGTTISFSAQRGCFPNSLFTAGYRGNTVTRLLTGAQEAAWSRDGTRVAFASAVDVFPDVTRPASVYDREGFANNGASLTRLVLYEDGTFDHQKVSVRGGFARWSGHFQVEGDIRHFSFWTPDGVSGDWIATGVLDGERMTVTYNAAALSDGFEDGVYVLSEAQP